MKESPETLIPIFFDGYSKALLRFQFLEESLRMYLSRCYEIIRKNTKGLILFKYTYADLQKRTMGALAEDFRRTNGNALLTKDIIILTKDRNYCAHTALLMTSEEANDINYIKKEIIKMNDISERAKNCLEGLIAEIKALDEMASKDKLL